MLSIYFLFGVFSLSFIVTIVASFLTYYWFDDERAGLSFLFATVFFIATCTSGYQLFLRLEAADVANGSIFVAPKNNCPTVINK